MNRLLLLPVLALCASACATSPKSFYANPAKQDVTSLCRTLVETTDPVFQRDVAVELVRRKMTAESCAQKVERQDQALTAIAVVGTVAAVGVIAANGGGGGYSAPSPGPDYDCYGGRGDGPLFVQGPVSVTYPDRYDLDADNDGIGCEAIDVVSGR